MSREGICDGGAREGVYRLIGQGDIYIGSRGWVGLGGHLA